MFLPSELGNTFNLFLFPFYSIHIIPLMIKGNDYVICIIIIIINLFSVCFGNILMKKYTTFKLQ